MATLSVSPRRKGRIGGRRCYRGWVEGVHMLRVVEGVGGDE